LQLEKIAPKGGRPGVSSVFKAQNRCCAICKTPVPNTKKGWNTDHDHKTNKVRGVLCGRCNSILGYAGERSEILQAAIAYLEAHRG
jgi:hypothetical protein